MNTSTLTNHKISIHYFNCYHGVRAKKYDENVLAIHYSPSLLRPRYFGFLWCYQRRRRQKNYLSLLMNQVEKIYSYTHNNKSESLESRYFESHICWVTYLSHNISSQKYFESIESKIFQKYFESIESK